MSLLLLYNQNLQQAQELTNAINSAEWPDIEQRLASNPQAVESIRIQIGKLEEVLAKANLTNAERVQAGASIDALKSLVQVPNPEWKSIVAILSGPSITALCNVLALAGIVETILKLILY